MFTKESLDSVGVESTWRKSQKLAHETKGCQTRTVHSANAEVQTGSTTVSSSQTEPQDQRLEQHLSHSVHKLEISGLNTFLHQVEDVVIKELSRNTKSHAFDGFQVNWEDQSQSVSCTHCLQHPGAKERGLHVTCLTWNCTGSIIACAYGRIDDGDWSNESSYVCTWNLDRQCVNQNQPDLIIDVAAAVTALSFHPIHPSLIAGGLYTGEVLAWDISQTQDPVVAQAGMSADSHREAVYQVDWVPVQETGELGVLSASSGGKVLIWMLDSAQGRFVLSSGFAFVRQQLPHSSSAHIQAWRNMYAGVTSLALSPWDPDTFLVGSEGGLLLRCSFSAETPAAVSTEGQSVALRAPAVFSFKPRGSPVHSIHCSPFHRNLFLSVGADGMAHLHSLLQAQPLLSLRVSDSYVFHVRWSPARPVVFAAATAQGVVQIFDLGQRSLRPAATIEQNSAGQAATCLAFNSRNTRLLAVGGTDGQVNIWHLSTDLTEQRPQDMAHLEQLANEVAE
ncbi:WD repeat-containing protein 34 [Lampris incognitus]|uniref:WD repeat-containing protein 34 n=1 Tax=Lampris incognitus TaxID=2546036 RepID=UPI0024B5FF2A|nr:WD repeat-containing protein 34 [Lampris incognitus]